MAGVRTLTYAGLTMASDAGTPQPNGGVLYLDDVEGWDGSPGLRHDDVPRLWSHGSFAQRGWREPLLLNVIGEARAASESAADTLKRQIVAVAANGLDYALTIQDTAAPTMTVHGYRTSPVKTAWLNDVTLSYRFEVLCTDPRKYGETLTDSTGIPVAGGGLSHPLHEAGYLDYGDTGYPGTASLTNRGTADTATKHTIVGAIPNGFTITELTTGRRLIYTAPIVAGQTLTLDADDGTVMLDGYANRSTFLTRREWTRLEPGQTGTWLFEALGSTGAQMTVEANPAWW